MRNSDLSLKKAQPTDCRLLFEWANDLDVRSNSFSSNLIAWPDHQAWFKSMIHSPNAVIYILVTNNIPVGQIRFLINQNHTAELHYSIAREFRGNALGKSLITMGESELLNEFSNIRDFLARVKPQNKSSCVCLEWNKYVVSHSRSTPELIVFEKQVSPS